MTSRKPAYLLPDSSLDFRWFLCGMLPRNIALFAGVCLSCHIRSRTRGPRAYRRTKDAGRGKCRHWATRRTQKMTAAAPTTERALASDSTRWGQLIFGIICMVMIANLQYGWTLFVNPIDQKYHWGRAAIQVAFTIFVLTETWLVPVEGYLIDKFGPKIMVSLSGALVAIAWVINSYADSLAMLYLGAAIGGVGAGIIYGAAVGNALKWFPDRRGLAAGLTAAGFGAGSALTVIPIANMIQSSGY